mmetsp:Transcript_101877/g.297085  ORF Transcript_101877/g.297085 Transcript_101877/m.297085 type:complete len:673 (+) Transcript_101877:1-2019(+)
MVQGGSKRRAAQVDKENEKSWCSYKSVLDVKINAASDLPDPPVMQYLEEVPMGMRGGPGDALAQAHGSPSVRNVQSLQRVLSRQCAEKACRALLWLSVGGVFEHLPKDELEVFREDLGENWYLVSLAIVEESESDRHLQDWVCAALPFALAQAIYRMLCDGFADDRKIFNSNADKLVGKVTQVVHFETTGFQMTADTVRKERRRLLQKHIFKNPHTNQREYLRGQRRQEMLESQNTFVGDQPLRFGEEDAQPLEETQLEHVHQGISEGRGQPRLVRKDTQGSLQPTSGVPPELSVERYANLSAQGAEMLEKQLEEFAYILGDMDEEEDLPEVQPELSCPGTPVSRGRTGTGQLTLPPGSVELNMSRRPSVSFKDLLSSDDEGSDAGLSLSPKSTTTRKSTGEKLNRRASVTAVAKFNHMKAQNRDKKAKEEKARKVRQELLLRKICVEKLPAELCERELSTTWVSPCQMSLMKAEDRNMSNKTSSDAHLLKMATRHLPVRPLSMPALRSKALDKSTDTINSSGLSGGKEEGSQAGANVGKSGRAGNPGPDGAAPSLPRVPSAGGGLHGAGASRLWATKGETISLEPPPRLSAKVIMRRLEDQAKASKQMSFALYMKEYDIFTDKLKRPVDEEKLRDEEDACLRRSDVLSGPPKRRLAPEDLRMKGGPKQQSS